MLLLLFFLGIAREFMDEAAGFKMKLAGLRLKFAHSGAIIFRSIPEELLCI